MTHDGCASHNPSFSRRSLTIHRAAKVEQLAPWLTQWERLTSRSRRYVPSTDDLSAVLEDCGKQLLICVAGHRDNPDAMIIFVIGSHTQRLSIGERKLLDIDLQAIRLLGCTPSLDQIDLVEWRTILCQASRAVPHDAIDLGEVAIGSSLERAFNGISWPALRLGSWGRVARHWTIDLPPTFDAYLGMLRSTTRKSIRYYLRRLAQSPDLCVHTISTPQQIDPFLSQGEAISRRTYQWDVGQRLENDPPTRARYHAAAEAGRLRCYLLYQAGRPIAFARGTIGGCVYHYETPGFLPEQGKLSPGLTLLAYAVRDLIESKSCTVFDFGTGGDMTGYKARFGTVSVPSRHLTLFNAARAKGVKAWIAAISLIVVKVVADAILRNSGIRHSIKARLRRYRSSE
jgi:hypothetical protein